MAGQSTRAAASVARSRRAPLSSRKSWRVAIANRVSITTGRRILYALAAVALFVAVTFLFTSTGPACQPPPGVTEGGYWCPSDLHGEIAAAIAAVAAVALFALGRVLTHAR